MAFDANQLSSYVDGVWRESAIPAIARFIEIPNQSPLFDAQWETNGHMDNALQLLVRWVEEQNVRGLTMEVIKEEGKTPVLIMEIPGVPGSPTALLYGHMDKQPPLTDAWSEGLHPYRPVIRDGKLYGRGGADDGYALFSAITAVKALHAHGVPHGRLVVMIEASEESGSRDLPHYIVKLKARIGVPSLIVCLDSGCGNYDQFWLTTSLRGLAVGTLRVDILTESVHSGYASGIVPDSFRILRRVLDKIEDVDTGEVICPGLTTPIPEDAVQLATKAADSLGDEVWNVMPFVQGAKLPQKPNVEWLLNKTWRPALSITGVDGMPTLEAAGNVLRMHTAVKLSMRVPPHVDAQEAGTAMKRALEADPPYAAKVEFRVEKTAGGWMAPPLAPWVEEAVRIGSLTYFGKEHRVVGEGGSIPFMGMLHRQFPDAQFVITGVLGPSSNAHGPNEFLHIAMSANVTKVVAHILAVHVNH
jgi:acetylornithine deacetylase/succinyl-diaminopimelate desuccinylase-like protein